MQTHVLDTDILTLFQRGHPVVRERVAAARAAVAVTVVTVEEQVGGRLARIRQATEPEELARAYVRLAETVTLLGSIPILTYEVPAMSRFDDLVRRKLNVKKNDLRIAAIALDARVTVVTRNRRDFERVPGLKIEDWSVPEAP